MLSNGVSPEISGGIQTFGRALQNIFKEDISFIDCFKTREKNKLYQVDNIITSVPFPSNRYIKKIIRVSQKYLNINLENIALKLRLRTLKPGICILRSPQDLKIIAPTQKKILVQHNMVDNLIINESYFNNEALLLEKVKHEINYFVSPSPDDISTVTSKLKIPKEKVIYIRHSCEIPLNNIPKVKSRNLIMIARLNNDHKRFDLAIRAMKKLKDFRLNIYGDGGDRSALEELVSSLNIKNVIFHGATNKVKDALDKNSIFIMTSDREGYGITNIEAMRRGLPLIVRNTFEAANDVIKGNGVLLKYEWDEDQFINAVIDTYENYEAYSKRSIQMGKRHDPMLIAKQWKKLISRLNND